MEVRRAHNPKVAGSRPANATFLLKSPQKLSLSNLNELLAQSKYVVLYHLAWRIDQNVSKNNTYSRILYLDLSTQQRYEFIPRDNETMVVNR